MSKVIGTYWFTTLHGFFGIVKVKTEEGTKFYIGPAHGDDEKKDANHIHQYGSPIIASQFIDFLTDDKEKEFQEDDKPLIEKEVTIPSKKQDYIYAALFFMVAIVFVILYIQL